jgi:GlpG protein
MSLFLVCAPPLEAKLGPKVLARKVLVCAVSGALCNAAFCDTGLIGASGIVFALVLMTPLVACADLRTDEVPASFVALAFVYIGKEAVAVLEEGNAGVSHFGHIVGGLLGAALGFMGREDPSMRARRVAPRAAGGRRGAAKGSKGQSWVNVIFPRRAGRA